MSLHGGNPVVKGKFLAFLEDLVELTFLGIIGLEPAVVFKSDDCFE
jgi:hypothetical protein